MKIKRRLTAGLAAGLAAAVALTPIASFAKELKKTEYNPQVVNSNNQLKPGYTETDDTTKTWWKTETWYTDWSPATEAEYNAVTDPDLKMVDEDARTAWRQATYEEYMKYVASGDINNHKIDGTTDPVIVDYETYLRAAADLRSASYGEFVDATKAEYDAMVDDMRRRTGKTGWIEFANTTNWESKFADWLKYPEEDRQFLGSTDWQEVDKATYDAFAPLYGDAYFGKLFKYEDKQLSSTPFNNWVFFEQQIIANTYNATYGHDPYQVLVGNMNISNTYSGCENFTWDQTNDGIITLNENNGTDAQNIAAGTLAYLDDKGITYTTITSGNQIPKQGATKKNAHVNDGLHNAGADGGNGFIDIVDEDFKIYYYAGTDEITVAELYGILIAPNATVSLSGKWIGTVIADTVNVAGTWHESTRWTYPEGKGNVERHYYICDPTLNVREITYQIREAEYKTWENKYWVNDLEKKYYVRTLEEKKFYVTTENYTPQTGDLTTIFVIAGIVAVVAVGGVLIIVSSRKNKRNTR